MKNYYVYLVESITKNGSVIKPCLTFSSKKAAARYILENCQHYERNTIITYPLITVNDF